jgi:hypothetical protein
MSGRRFRGTFLAAALGLGALLVSATGAGASGERVLKVKDRCEPVSFNAALFPGACVGDGMITFSAFITQLMNHQEAFAWSFRPARLTLGAGRNLRADNVGGEFHSVTRVAEFGGGFVPELNELSGNPIPAPECFGPPSATNLLLPAGASGVFTSGVIGALLPGENRLLCCIHPWMRSTVDVRGGDD